MTPSLFKSLDIGSVTTLKYLLLGGEAFPQIEQDRIPDEARVFNIYGVTEMSSWQSMVEVKPKEHSFTDQVPIFSSPNLLSETEVGLYDSVSGEEIQEAGRVGEVWILSRTRRCFVLGENDQNEEFYLVKTKDLGVKDDSGRIFYRGRLDDQIKIHGRRLTLLEIENKWQTILKVQMVPVLKNDKLFGVMKNSEEGNIEKELHKLPPYMIPAKVIAIKEEFPITANGKIDRDELVQRLEEKASTETVLNPCLEQSWIKFTGLKPREESRFLEDGGDSYTALLLAETIAPDNQKLAAKILEALLTQSCTDVQGILDGRAQDHENVEVVNSTLTNGTSPSLAKKIKLEHKPIDIVSKGGTSLVDCDSTKIREIKQVWKQDLGKCIDASPLLVEAAIYIGSHSGIFGAFNAKSGEEIWKIDLGERIEATAATSEDGALIFVGTYGKALFCIDRKSGIIHWQFSTNDIIKSTPAVTSSSISFGCHDKFLYRLNIADGSLRWKTSTGAMVTSPVLHNDSSLICATLSGDLKSVSLNDGNIIWSTTLDSPVFSTPKAILDESVIFVISVKATVYSFKAGTGDLLWKRDNLNHKTEDVKVFSSPIEVKERSICIVGSHASKVFAFDSKSGDTVWTVDMTAPIYSTPFLMRFRRKSESVAIFVDINGHYPLAFKIQAVRKSFCKVNSSCLFLCMDGSIFLHF